MKNIYLISLIVVSAIVGCQNNKNQIDSDLIIASADSSAMFAPGIVSTHLAERDAALSPNGNEFMFTVTSYTRPVIVSVKKGKNGWSKPETVSFSGEFSDLEPHFSPDGNRVYFASNRPLIKGDEPKDFDIWYVDRIGENWGEPENIGSPINTNANEFYPSITNNGTLYWCAIREDNLGIGGEDIYYSKLENGRYKEVVALPDSINTIRDEYNAFVARDESYIIFTSSGWGKGFGRGDLWISYKLDSTQWSKAINMGEKINSSAFEFCPFVSDCGRYLFFTSDRIDELKVKDMVTYNQINSFSLREGNKQNNIFVINANIIEELKPVK